VTAVTSPRPELGLLLRLAHQRAAKAFSDALQPLGIEGRHFGVLMTLARSGPRTQSQLIAELGSDKSSMVRTVDDLERLGLCQRRPVPGDRRARAVEMTTQGRGRFTAAKAVAERVGADLFGSLTDREQATLRDLLIRFISE
jgi:MarR family transcriptional regulator, lower aerobic nicotinate degradation pathway regulator